MQASDTVQKEDRSSCCGWHELKDERVKTKLQEIINSAKMNQKNIGQTREIFKGKYKIWQYPWNNIRHNCGNKDK